MLPDTATGRSIDALEAPAAFSLHQPGWVWIVRSGELDVFATASLDGGAVGALRPLFRVQSGEAVFGLPRAERLGIMLIAKGSYDCRVERCAAAAMRNSASAGSDEPAVTHLVDKWILEVSRAAVNAPVPKTLELLDAGACTTVGEEPGVFSSRGRVIWVQHIAGISHYLGLSGLTVRNDALWYPVSNIGWIEAQPGAEFVSADTGPALQADAGWKGLDVFHQHALVRLGSNLSGAEEIERERLRTRSDADSLALEAALHDLASPLKTKRARQASATEILEAPLLSACRVIGDRIGVTMKASPDMRDGTSVRDPVAAIARASGIRFRRVALKDDWWKQGSEPLLVFRDVDNQPAALLPRSSGRGYSMYCPPERTPVRVDPAVAASLNPFGYMFYPAFPAETLSPLRLLALGFKDSGRELRTIAVMSIAAGLLTVLLPIVTGIIFDSLIPDARRTELLAVSGLLVVAAMSSALLNLTRGFAVLRLQGKFSARIQAGVWDRLLSLPVPFFRQYAAGDLANRSMAISQIRSVLTASTLNAILSGFFSVFSFGLLFYYSARLSLIATALTLFAAIVTVVAGLFEVRLQRDIASQFGTIAGMVLEFITGIAKFRVAGAERRAFVLWVKGFAKQKRTDFSARQVTNVLTVFNSVYLLMCLAVLFAANGVPARSTDNALSTGQFLAFITAFSQFMFSVLALSAAVVGIMNIVPLYERVSPILQTPPETRPTQADPIELSGQIEAYHLQFRYRADTPLVVRDVSFRIDPGEYVAFVGPSGCGKSTLFRLLLGFESLESGAIYYDGKDLSGLDPHSVRSQIGVVLQSGVLMAGSIQENIAGATTLTADDVWEAARLAGFDEDLRRMPMGLYTMVNAGGGGLSGGQRQRLLIARAIARKPRVLLFDEATSALDNRTQAVVSNSLKSLKATRIVIAHRLSTILEADRIFVLDQGRIVQSGTYASLMAEAGLFRQLAERQLM